MKTISRGQGRSATAAAAYRSGQKIEDTRTGQTLDYSGRSGVLMAEIILPDGGSVERERLWNAAELAEKRCNSVVAREIVVALPHELSREQQTALVKGYAQGLSERTGWAVDVAIHEPGREGDLRNTHAHLLCSTRIIERDPSGCPVMKRKTREWDIRSSGSILIRSERSEWERCVNQSLEQAEEQSRVDCRSHAEKQTGLEPQVHLGPTVTAMERQGIQTERGDEHRRIAAHNGQVIELAQVREKREEVQAWVQELDRLDRLPIEAHREAVEKLCPPRIEDIIETHPSVQVVKGELEAISPLVSRWNKAFQEMDDRAAGVLNDYEYQHQFYPRQLQMAEQFVSFNGGITKLLKTQDKVLGWCNENEPRFLEVESAHRKLEERLMKARQEAASWAVDERERRMVPFNEAYERLLKAEEKSWSEEKDKLKRMPYAEMKKAVESICYVPDERSVACQHPRLRQIPRVSHRAWEKEKGELDAFCSLRHVRERREKWCEQHPVKTFLHNSNLQKAPSLLLYDARICHLEREHRKAKASLEQAEGKIWQYREESKREASLIQTHVRQRHEQLQRFRHEAQGLLQARQRKEPEHEQKLQQERERGGGRGMSR